VGAGGRHIRACNDSDFWKQPVYQHWRAMLETGRQFPYPGPRMLLQARYCPPTSSATMISAAGGNWSREASRRTVPRL